jgi:polysaccharide biosynthesis protein PslH
LKILVLCREFPLPLSSGEKIRVFHIIKGLARHHDITLVSLMLNSSELCYVEEMKRFCHSVYPFEIKLKKKLSAIRTVFSTLPWDVLAFYSEEMKIKVRELIQSQSFDILWVNFLSMSNYIESCSSSKSKRMLDLHNIDELVWQHYARYSNNLAMKIFASINQLKVESFQHKILNNYHTAVCVSQADADYMKVHYPDVNIWLIPNGVDTEYFIPKNLSKKSNIIMLCASMDVTMNIDAALNFAKIFPKIKQKIPDCEFWIVGRNPPAQIRDLNHDGYIKVTGSVDDVRPYYEQARVIVAPYRFGGGTKLKILEAMAMNLPIIATSVGCQGIDTSGVTQIPVCDDMEQFARTVIELLESKDSGNNLYTNGARQIVEERYSWNSISRRLEAGLSDLIK